MVWANRGGGKTYLGAIATVLDMVFKCGIQVRLLAGSLQQGRLMFTHVQGFLEKQPFASMLKKKPTQRRIVLHNGSCVQLVAASQTGVRGQRVQKLRCDEVDLFARPVWEAAQLTTHSLDFPGPWGKQVRGSVEVFSTMQNPQGLMWEIVKSCGVDPADPAGGAPAAPIQVDPRADNGPQADAAASPERLLFRWGIIDAR